MNPRVEPLTSSLSSDPGQVREQNEELTFYSDVQEAVSDAAFDAVYASGSIQYTPDPYATLEMLCNIPSKRLVITRTPMADEDLTLLQTSRMRDNGPGPVPELMESLVGNQTVTYPVTVLCREKSLALISTIRDIDLEITEDQVRLYSSVHGRQMHGVIALART